MEELLEVRIDSMCDALNDEFYPTEFSREITALDNRYEVEITVSRYNVEGIVTGCLATSEEIENADFDTMERMVENFVFNLRRKVIDVYCDLMDVSEEEGEEYEE